MARPAPAPDEHERLVDLLGDTSRPRLAGRLLGRTLAAGALGGLLAKLVRAPARARGPTRAVTRLHARILRLSGGRMRRSWLFAAGQPVMVLTTVGRHSGARRETPVTGFAHEGKLASAGMNLGSELTPGWAHNLMANPAAWVVLRGRTIPVTARLAEGAEREQLWKRWLELQPSSEALARLAGREIPLFVFERRAEDAPDQGPEYVRGP
jgi:deazaflavin-dependent oxidoreductase (nitroreductase family)